MWVMASRPHVSQGGNPCNAVIGSKVKTGSLSIADISGASLSKLSRVAYATGPNLWVPSMTQAPVATASLKVPKRGFVLV